MATKEHFTMDSSSATLRCPDHVRASQLPSIRIGVNMLGAWPMVTAMPRAAAKKSVEGQAAMRAD